MDATMIYAPPSPGVPLSEICLTPCTGEKNPRPRLEWRLPPLNVNLGLFLSYSSASISFPAPAGTRAVESEGIAIAIIGLLDIRSQIYLASFLNALGYPASYSLILNALPVPILTKFRSGRCSTTTIFRIRNPNAAKQRDLGRESGTSHRPEVLHNPDLDATAQFGRVRKSLSRSRTVFMLAALSASRCSMVYSLLTSVHEHAVDQNSTLNAENNKELFDVMLMRTRDHWN
ncbi:hypothetical protein C8R44DRAFT_752548 [Mycena epipterygia]|nr:hypothetical protein C8R44DRAFT_752548 [Mycena epipterygia]